jgi:hypothetical protein
MSEGHKYKDIRNGKEKSASPKESPLPQTNSSITKANNGGENPSIMTSRFRSNAGTDIIKNKSGAEFYAALAKYSVPENDPDLKQDSRRGIFFQHRLRLRYVFINAEAIHHFLQTLARIAQGLITDGLGQAG